MIENVSSNPDHNVSTIGYRSLVNVGSCPKMSSVTALTECLPASNVNAQTNDPSYLNNYTNLINSDLKGGREKYACSTNNKCVPIIHKTKNTKKMWTLEEDKLLIQTLLQITKLSADEISAKVIRDNANTLTQVLGRVLSSIVGRWSGYLQPIILSDIHGKLNYNVVPDVYSFLIQQKIKKIDNVDWKEMVNRWPYQTEQSLKLIVRNAKGSGKAQQDVHLHQKLKHLLRSKRKPIPSKDQEFNITIATFFNNILKSKHVSKSEISPHIQDVSMLKKASPPLICNPVENVSKLLQTNEDFMPSQKCHSTPTKKSNWSLDEEKILIKTIFEIKPDLNASHIDEKIAKEIFPLVHTRINRPLPSIMSHWFLILQPLILSNMYGKLEYPITAAVFSHLITQRVESVHDINWSNLLHIWPFQNEKSLKSIVNRASDDARLPPGKDKLYEKLHVLLQYYANKKITPKKMRTYRDIIEFYETIMKKKRQAEYKKM